ncbi:hypothetical protein Fcan01_23883 [Folsomia candida]|uniref:Uncharacterized protein n=1 Tax=Folsomia candida TaxID=158441 RepID=A0A226DA77_FOLCA|nr:hypothetical protein Fcan01_23883 [Folsomia candida]
MLSAILLPHLKRNFQLGQFYRCLNYDWDSSRNQVIPSSRISQGCARVYLLASIFYVIVKFIGILSSSVPLSDKIFHVALGWIYAASTVVGTELIANPAIVQLMNLIYQPQEHGGTTSPSGIWNGKKFLKLIDLTYSLLYFTCDIIFPPIMALLLIFLPCQAPLLGSLILPKNESGILFLWEESSKILSYPKFSLGYRKLQVMESVLNGAIRSKLFPILLIISPCMQIIATFAVIKFQHVMPAAGATYRTSCYYLKSLKGMVNNSLETKLLKSYTPLKIRFGSNFMDELTPLIIQQFCTMQTINLLLLL